MSLQDPWAGNLHETAQQLLQMHYAFWFASYPSFKQKLHPRNCQWDAISWRALSIELTFTNGPAMQHCHIIVQVKDSPLAGQPAHLIILRWDVNGINSRSAVLPYSKYRWTKAPQSMRSTITCIILHTAAKITADITQLLFSAQEETAAIQENNLKILLSDLGYA